MARQHRWQSLAGMVKFEAHDPGTVARCLSRTILVVASRLLGRRHFIRRRSFRPTSAAGWSADDENDQAATGDAFEVLHFIAGKRLAAGD